MELNKGPTIIAANKTEDARYEAVELLRRPTVGLPTIAAIESYGDVIQDITALIKGKRRPFGSIMHKWHEPFINELSTNSWRARYWRSLAIPEVAIWLEVTQRTSYSDLLFFWGSGGQRHKGLENLFASPELSTELKLAIACELPKLTPCALWLFAEDNGIHLPTVIKNRGPGPYYASEITMNIAACALFADRPASEAQGEQLLRNLRSDVVTRELLGNLLFMKDKPEGEQFVGALALHARRLYDFDESIPDEWVLRAIS